MSDLIRGNQLLRSGYIEEAIAAYQKAISSCPNFHWSYCKLGEALEQCGSYEEAIDAYQKAIKLNPNFIWSRYQLGIILAKNDKINEGINILEKVLNLDSKTYQYYQKLYTKLLTQKVTKKFTNNFPTQSFLAAWQLRLGTWSQVFDPRYRGLFCNTFGIMEANCLLPNITHESLILKEKVPIVKSDSQSKKYVFISGMPRSGTTACGRLLNLSNDIGIFTELFSPCLSYSPNSFQDNCIKQTISNHRHEKQNKTIFSKIKKVKYIGDKRPLFQYFMVQSLENFKDNDVFIFHILRPVYEVCLSYEKRAENPQDKWRKTSKQCIHEINITNKFICDFLENQTKSNNHYIVFLDYKKLFTNKEYVYSILKKMKVQITNDLQQRVDDFIESSQNIISKKRSQRKDIREKINALLDFKTAKKVEYLTGVTILDNG